jgi:hypothetical protein
MSKSFCTFVLLKGETSGELTPEQIKKVLKFKQINLEMSKSFCTFVLLKGK